MAGATLPVRSYRRLAQVSTLASVAAVVAALFALMHGRWGLALLPFGAAILSLYSLQRLAIREDPAAQHLLIFVTKDGCTLCDEAKALLPNLVEGTPFRVEEVRLEDDKLMRKTFRDRVPVLLWQGEVLADLAWDSGALRARLATISATPPTAP